MTEGTIVPAQGEAPARKAISWASAISDLHRSIQNGESRTVIEEHRRRVEKISPGVIETTLEVLGLEGTPEEWCRNLRLVQ